ncbi:MAG: rod shape-determining protein MreD [Eubacterium sp.]|nr:rod shape-determining protein MreD [Eubacterium sp.]
MKKKVIKIIVTAVIILLAFVIQSTLSLHLNTTVPAPNLLLLVTCLFGFIRGQNFGSVTGLCCGLLMDVMFGDVIGLYALIFAYIGFFSGLFKNLLHMDHIYVPMFLVFGNDFLLNAAIYVFRFLLRNKLDFSFYFRQIIFPEMLITAFIALLVYKLFYKLNDKIYIEKQESELNFGK